MKSAVDVGTTFSFQSVPPHRAFERTIVCYGLAVLSVAIALGIKLILLHFSYQIDYRIVLPDGSTKPVLLSATGCFPRQPDGGA
jgi:hypothetical protein